MRDGHQAGNKPAARGLPPVAKKVPHVTRIHGARLVDDYFYLRDKTNPAVVRHIKAENDYAAAALKSVEALRVKLSREFIAKVRDADCSVPEKIGAYYYYHRTEKGKQYPIHCRKKGSLTGREEIILDENSLAERPPFFRVSAFAVSPDHRYLAYAVDADGETLWCE